MATTSVIITAGGIGKRMKSSLPKQFLLVNQKPILMHTIEQFYHFDAKFELILTLPDDWHLFWEELMVEHDFRIPHRVISGGEERYHSVKNALSICSGDQILVHDGVRPIVDHDLIERCLKKLRNKDAVIPVVPVYESLRQNVNGKTAAVDRKEYIIVQTPQCFKREAILKGYEKDFHEGVTDDATIVEEAGFEIYTVQGNKNNIKITHQGDLKIAETILN
jgi:2-C-methyl-D-erythritol 4-phosphate cytidylyltransferase